MDKNTKRRWLEALRGGEYNQTQECLKDSNGFCCLGVLADVEMVKNGSSTWEENDLNHLFMLVVDEENEIYEDCYLPLTHHFGLKDRGLLPVADENYKSLETELMKMNDSGLSFAEIADWIEKNVPEDE